MLEGLPQSCATPEIKLETAEGEQFALVERCARKADFPARSRSTIWTACGWITSTASAWRGRPTPRRRSLRFEGDTMAALARIEEDFRNALRRVAPHVRLPF